MVHVNLFAKQKWDTGVENKHILLFYLGSQKSLEPWHIPHCAGWLWTGWLWHCALLSLGMSSCPLCQIMPTANCVTGDSDQVFTLFSLDLPINPVCSTGKALFLLWNYSWAFPPMRVTWILPPQTIQRPAQHFIINALLAFYSTHVFIKLRFNACICNLLMLLLSHFSCVWLFLILWTVAC